MAEHKQNVTYALVVIAWVCTVLCCADCRASTGGGMQIICLLLRHRGIKYYIPIKIHKNQQESKSNNKPWNITVSRSVIESRDTCLVSMSRDQSPEPPSPSRRPQSYFVKSESVIFMWLSESRRLEKHIYTDSCLGSSLVAPYLVLALSWCVLAQYVLHSYDTS